MAAIGIITAVVALATQTYSAQQTVGPVPLPAKFSRGVVVIDWTQVTDLTSVVSLAVSVSTDGVTFNPVGGFTLDMTSAGNTLGTGGIGLVDPNGVPFRTSDFSMRIPGGGLTTRQIQAVLSMTTPVTTGVTVAVW